MTSAQHSVAARAEQAAFYAHSAENRPQSEWHRLEDHLRDVARKAAAFAEAFGCADWAHAAGLLHDVGKAHPEFQAYLLRQNSFDASDYDGYSGASHPNHSGAGAILAVNRWHGPMKIIGKTLAYIMAGHHAGLPDWYGGQDALSYRLEKERVIIDAIQPQLLSQLSDLPTLLRPPAFAAHAASYHLWVRILFSCLVDADFLDTEAWMNPNRAKQRPAFAPLSELKEQLDQTLQSLIARAEPTSLNQMRTEILTYCRTKAVEEPGLFSLSVPTGGGKTLSGTAFALDHALRHGKRRVIYVIPYTSIIEQTADVLRECLGNDNVVEHHSNIAPDNQSLRLQLAAENWDAPIIVTTNVQFFESLYAAKPSRCRKLHNIVNSVIILDEAQLLPPEWLHPCVEAINRLVTDYGVTIVLSTATQPALPSLCCTPREIVPEPSKLYAQLNRTVIHLPADMHAARDWPSLAAELMQHQQILCIVNRRQDCYELWQCMPEGTIHLSALMCGAHRSKVIKNIKDTLDDGAPVRVISTQLVEAGVDIDFPVVYRALAGLDSINQAAGRCNREGKLSCLGNVHVFVPPKPAPRGLLRKGEDASRSLLSVPDFKLDAPESFTRYFEQYYQRVNDTGADWLDRHLVKDVNPDGNVSFRTAGNEFRLIKDATIPIVVRYGTNAALIESLRHAGPSREIMRALQRFTVSVYPATAARLESNGFVERLHESILVQTVSSIYTDTTGFDIFRECYAAEELCQ